MPLDGFRKGSFGIVFWNLLPDGSERRETVSGYILGYFGIHHQKTFWQITHIPTGLRMTPRGETAPAYLAQAKAIVRRLTQMFLPWASLTAPEARRIQPLVRAVYQDEEKLAEEGKAK